MEINVPLNKLMSFFWNYDTNGKNYSTLGIWVRNWFTKEVATFVFIVVEALVWKETKGQGIGEFMDECGSNEESPLVPRARVRFPQSWTNSSQPLISKLLCPHFGVLTTGMLPSQLGSLQRSSEALFITKIKTIVCLQEKNN